MIYLKSLWEAYIENRDIERVDSDISCEVLVIGGGICGLLCAYQLKEFCDVIVVERDRIGMGITKNMTASISVLQDKLYQDRILEVGFDKAKLYLEANQLAVEAYKKLGKELDFDFVEKSTIAYSTKSTEIISKEYAILESLGCKPVYRDKIELPFKIKGALEVYGQGECNPIKLCNCLAKHLTIFEDTKIEKIKKNYAITQNGYKIFAKHIMLATHYPFKEKKGLYFSKLHQMKSDVVAIKMDSELKSNYLSMEKGGLYVRSYNGYHIYGGVDERVGCFNSRDLTKEVEGLLNKEGSFSWRNQDLITLDEMPYIGNISFWYPNIYVGTGFNAFGLTGSMLTAILLKDYILGVPNPYQQLFSPQRKYYLKSYFVQMLRSAKSLLSIGGKRCKHMGCKLKYNEITEQYECECHGSVFNKDGSVCHDPAKKKL